MRGKRYDMMLCAVDMLRLRALQRGATRRAQRSARAAFREVAAAMSARMPLMLMLSRYAMLTLIFRQYALMPPLRRCHYAITITRVCAAMRGAVRRHYALR